MLTGAVCFTVHYVQGRNTNISFVKLTCPVRKTSFTQAIREHGCIDNLPHCSYTLSATDVDAVDSIDTMPAVLIERIVLPGPANVTLFTSETEAVMPTTTGTPRGIRHKQT